MPNTHHEFLEWRGCDSSTRIRYNNRLAPLLARPIYSPHVTHMDFFDTIGCRNEIADMLIIGVKDEETDEETFESIAWLCTFSNKEKIYGELCREFYETFEFNKVCVKPHLRTKQIIHFCLGGKAQDLTLVQFARRLGLYDADELEEPVFNDYFDYGLRTDEEFNATEFWDTISDGIPLALSRSSATRIHFSILRVIYKMITYGLFQRVNGYEKIQKVYLWFLSMFHNRHQDGYANVAWVIAKWMKRKGTGSQQISWIYGG